MKNKKIVLKGKPQEKQRLFFEAKEKYVAYGGARGGGKSWALRRKVILMCMRYPGLSVLIIRRTFPELRENHIRPMLSELKDIASFTESRKCFEFPNGSRIKMGYLDREDDVLQYQGQEFDVIALDEATQLSEYQFQTLKGALRGANNFPKRMYLTCNPGGIGHSWVKRLFVDREFRRGESPGDYRFIPAMVFDNKALLECDPDYVSRLESLPPSLRDAWLFGKWEVFEGQFFPEFDHSVHVCAPFDIPEDATRFCAIDYGLDMLAALFVALMRDGRAVVYDEIYKSGLIVSEAAELIKQKMNGVTAVIAPQDLWNRQKDSGKSINELFCENGVYLTKISPERIGGWLCLKEWLAQTEDENGAKTPKMKIFNRCANLIRSLPALMHDPSKPGDASTRPHEITHAPDALRYFASYRSFVSAGREKQTPKVKLKHMVAKNIPHTGKKL